MPGRKPRRERRPAFSLSQVSLAVGLGLGISLGALAVPTYTVVKVLVAEDQWQGEAGLIDPAPVFKPHETDAAARYWISSNERGEEGAPSKAGITIFEVGTNKVLAQLNIDNGCLSSGWTVA
jgi:hypothetical protein